MIDWINKNKVSVALVGGAIVIGSQWAKCTIEPNVDNIGDDDAIQQIQPEAEEASSDSPASEENN